MNISPELQQIIAQARQEMLQLSGLSDEQVAQLIVQAIPKHEADAAIGREALGQKSARELNDMGYPAR